MRVWLGLLVMLGCACAGVPTKPARIAQSCPAVPSRRVAGAPGFQRAFIEVASVKKRHLPRKLGKLQQEPVELQGEAGVLVEHEVPEYVQWARCLDRDCELQLQRTMMIASVLPRTESEPVRVSVLIREGQGAKAAVYADEVSTRNQQAATLPEHGNEGSVLVVTPYLIGADEDVEVLRECLERKKAEDQGSK